MVDFLGSNSMIIGVNKRALLIDLHTVSRFIVILFVAFADSTAHLLLLLFVNQYVISPGCFLDFQFAEITVR